MRAEISLFLALLLAHLLGDFVFQTDAMVSGKGRGEPGAFLRHGAVHLATALVLILLFVPQAGGAWKLYPMLLLLTGLHLLVDLLKERTLASWLTNKPRSGFLADQLLHLALVFGWVTWFGGAIPVWTTEVYTLLLAHRETVMTVCAVYVATIFAGGYFIRVVLPEPPHEGEATGDRGELSEEWRAGMYIGWLERFLVLTAVIAKSPTAIGLIVTAKSIVRFKRVEKGDAFAEYFLLGTFLSLALALLGGLVLRWWLFGGLDLE